MNENILIDKVSHIESNLSVDIKNINLTNTPTIVRLNLSKDDILEIRKEYDNAVIVLKNGEVITLNGFFKADHSLVLNSNNELLWVRFTDEQGVLLDNIIYSKLESTGLLLYSEGVANPLFWAAVPLAAGGVLAWAGDDNNSTINNSNSNSDDNGIADDVDGLIADAEAAVKAAEDAYAAADQALADANVDGVINSAEHDVLVKALEDAIAAKDAAQDAVDALPDSVKDAKDDFQDRLDGLSEITVPAVNDTDDNGIADDVDGLIADAEAAVKAAEDAYAAADQALAAATADHAISQAEYDALVAARDDAKALKDAAQAKVEALPDTVSDAKADFQDRLDGLSEIIVPAVNDTDDNGIADDVDGLIADAEAAVKAAEQAYQDAEDALADANVDGVISSAEHDVLVKALEDAIAAKDAAQDAVDALPDSVKDAKADFQDRLDGLSEIIVPAVNDTDDNGIADDVDGLIADAEAAVKAAEDAYAAADQALADANVDGVINSAEHDVLVKALEDAIAAKEAAQDAVDALPDNVKDAKADFQDRLDGLSEIIVPAVNDTDDNGIADDVDGLIADAEAAVKAAEDAYAAADQALADANVDGVISSAEHDGLVKALEDEIAAKEAAQDAVDALPDSVQAEIDDFQDRLDGLTEIIVPAVNDTDDNGIADDVDGLIADAEAAVKAAEDAYAAADQALADANVDGVINSAEHDVLVKALEDAIAAKEAAQDAVDALPDNVKDAKDDFQDRLDGLSEIIVPAVNDTDDNGIADDVDGLIADAEAAVKAAEDAYAAADQALADATADHAISQAEYDALVAARDDAKALKDAAQAKVEALPDTVSDAKADFQDRLDGLSEIIVPAVNDTDDNGIADDVDGLIADAEAAVKAAEQAYKDAEDALADANVDGVISSAEHDGLVKALEDAIAAKEAAQDAVDALPDSVKDAKADFQDRLDGLSEIIVPAVNDTDDNGIADDVDGLIADAEAAVKAAEDAYAAADQALADATVDGVISSAEHDGLVKALEDAIAAKDAAQAKVEALPDTVSDAKADFQDRLDGLSEIIVPAVNDTDDNGIADDVDGLIADAEAAVKAAEDAYAAADQALADATADGVISSAEHDGLVKALEDAIAAKDAAQDAVDALPDSVKDAKADFQDRLDGLSEITVPAVNDTDDNGIADDVDGLIADAEAAVKAAEDAYAAADQALADATADHAISQAEYDALVAARDDAKALKDAAQDAVDALPDSVQAEIDDFQDRLDGLSEIIVPAVNDTDDNGIADDVDGLIADAEAAVKAAEDAYAAADQALADATVDGVISSAEHDGLVKALEDEIAAKEAAQDAVDALPDSVQAEIDDFQDRLDGLTEIIVPAVNDTDDNGIADDVDGLIADAEAAVKAAEDAYAAADQALADANVDGVINSAEHDVLVKALEDAIAAKEAAQDAVDALPDNVKDAKDDFQDRLDGLSEIIVPAVNDTDDNGIADDVDGLIADAEAAVKAAEQAYKDAEDALADANVDGVISSAEHDGLVKALEDAIAAKEAAQDAVDALPDSVKDAKADFQDRLDGLSEIIVPAVNDTDDNGIADDVDGLIADAEAAVKAAEDAYAAADQALADATVDGVISSAEHDGLVKALEDAIAAKDAAQAKVEALPDTVSDAKADFQDRLDGLSEIIVPAVNDTDDNGIADDVDGLIADAEAAVKAAEDAYAAADQALADATADGVISSAEHDGLVKALEDAIAAKDAAQDAVDALPDSVKDAKADFQDRLDGLSEITVPAVNDTDDNGIADDVDGLIADAEAAVKAAEDAYAAADQALADATVDGVISSAEHDGLVKALEDAIAAKDAAQAKVEALPDTVSDAKADFQDRLDGLSEIIVPAVNDTDDNGIADDVDGLIADAEAAVKAAEDAYAAADQALADATVDGVISSAEHDGLVKALEDAIAAKDAAQAKVEALPDTVSDAKADFQDRLDGLSEIIVPAVNDTDDNGIADDVDGLIADAEAAVKAAEDAYAAADQALADATVDGVINSAEHDGLVKALEDAIAAKEAAQDAVDALPDSVKDAKADFQDRLDGLSEITVPAVNDTDDNGIADDVDGLIADAEAAVKAAEDAYAAADQALADANVDGVINSAEHDVLVKALEDAIAAKEAAQDAVDALPDNVKDAKDDFQDRLDGLSEIIVPAVNDTDDNGIADDVDGLIADAEAAVKAAEDAYAAADQALADATADHAISQAEYDALVAARDDAKALKDAAQAKVEALPDTVSDAKADFQDRLDGLSEIIVPAVTDTTAPDAPDATVNAAGTEVIGHTEPNAIVKVYDSKGNVIGMDTADADGNFVITLTPAVGKGTILEVTATDEAGNESDKTTLIVGVAEIIAATDNEVDLILNATPNTITNGKPSDLNDNGFTIAKVGLGSVLGVGVLDDVVKNSIQFEVGQDQVREITVKGVSAGVQVLGTMDLYLYKLNETSGEWELQHVTENWVIAGLLAGASKNTDFSLNEGKWMFVMASGEGLQVLTGYGLQFSKDVILDYGNATSISGTAKGNMLTDNDVNHGQDELPVGTTLTQIQDGNGAWVDVNPNGDTVIEGKFGTLVVKADGSYTYTVNDDFRGYGEKDVFKYQVTSPTGQTAEAELSFELNLKPKEVQLEIDNTVVMDIETAGVEQTGGDKVKDAVGFALIDLGLLGPVLDASVLEGKGLMEFTVGEDQLRELILEGSAGGISVGKSFDLIVYKYDEVTKSYSQVHLQKDWFNVLLLGGKSEHLSLTFGEGKYIAMLDSKGGVGIAEGNGLYVKGDKVYDYNMPTKYEGQVTGDATNDDNTILLKVKANGVEIAVEPNTVSIIDGKYGVLTINSDGTYTYTVTKPINAPADWKPSYGEVDSFQLVTQDINGKTTVENLNIKIGTHTAGDDFNSTQVQEINIETVNADKASFTGLLDNVRSYTKEFDVAAHTKDSAFTLKVTTSSDGNIITGFKNAILTYRLTNTSTGEVFEHTVTARDATLNINLADLPKGHYKLDVTSVDGKLQNVEFSNTVLHSEDFRTVATHQITGDLLLNDEGKDLIDSLKIGNKEVYTDANKGVGQFSIDGLYGTLTVSKDGSYTYTPKGGVYGVDKFVYETTSKAGITESATLEINVGKTVTASEYSDSVSSSAGNDSFTMGEGDDTVIFNLLSDDNTGGNGHDTWTDFNMDQGDKINISNLLTDGTSLYDAITVDQDDNGNVVLKVDRDGASNNIYQSEGFITLDGVTKTDNLLDELINNGYIF